MSNWNESTKRLIKKLEKQITNLLIDRQEVDIRIAKLKERIGSLKYNIDLGDKISFEGKTGIVTFIDEFYIKVMLFKKDGKLGTLEVNCYKPREIEVLQRNFQENN